MRALRLSLIVASGLLLGCGDFDDPSTVKDLRILAVAAEPSEVILNVATEADVAGAVIPPMVLTPLIVDPLGRPVALTISACANDPNAPSPPNNGSDPTGYPAGGVRATVGSALCDGDPTRIVLAENLDVTTGAPGPLTLTPDWLIAAFQRDVFLGPDGTLHGGFDLGMPVVFQLTAQAGNETAIAVKRALFWRQPVRADQTPNRSPQMPGVRAYDRRDETTAEPLPDALEPVESGTTADVPPGGLWIEPVDAAAPMVTAEAESYVTATLDRLTGQVTPVDVKETLTYTFYASAGTFSPQQTSSEPPPGVTPQGRLHIESKYTPAIGGPRDVTIWIVVRDERGGASWVMRSLRVATP
jgi:hypothetical protein